MWSSGSGRWHGKKHAPYIPSHTYTHTITFTIRLPKWYPAMLLDAARNNAYRRAIARVGDDETSVCLCASVSACLCEEKRGWKQTRMPSIHPSIRERDVSFCVWLDVWVGSNVGHPPSVEAGTIPPPNSTPHTPPCTALWREARAGGRVRHGAFGRDARGGGGQEGTCVPSMIRVCRCFITTPCLNRGACRVQTPSFTLVSMSTTRHSPTTNTPNSHRCWAASRSPRWPRRARRSCLHRPRFLPRTSASST